jgi:DNA repair exonuclease SbcCD ATPase subunit
MEIQKENEHYKRLYEKSLETLKEKNEDVAHLQGQLKERREWIRSLESELGKFRNQAAVCPICSKIMFWKTGIDMP